MARKYATADAVDLPGFIRSRHRMVLNMFRSDGPLQTWPVTGGVDERGRIVTSS
jgi:hypothetical protein